MVHVSLGHVLVIDIYDIICMCLLLSLPSYCGYNTEKIDFIPGKQLECFYR